VKDVRIFSNY